MKFTPSWLKDHLDTTASAAEVVDAMTMAGLEVEHVDDPGAKLAAFSVARIVEAENCLLVNQPPAEARTAATSPYCSATTRTWPPSPPPSWPAPSG